MYHSICLSRTLPPTTSINHRQTEGRLENKTTHSRRPLVWLDLTNLVISPKHLRHTAHLFALLFFGSIPGDLFFGTLPIPVSMDNTSTYSKRYTIHCNRGRSRGVFFCGEWSLKTTKNYSVGVPYDLYLSPVDLPGWWEPNVTLSRWYYRRTVYHNGPLSYRMVYFHIRRKTDFSRYTK